MPVDIQDFGSRDGRPIRLFTLRNTAGTEACVSSLGATLARWTAPDRNRRYASVVLGYSQPGPYLTGNLPYFNSIVGRYANRIADGRFTLDGTPYQLSRNEGPTHLHGGVEGFDKKIWEAETAGDNAVTFRYTSPAGEEGYPGTVHATVCYDLDDRNTLTVTCEATADAPTIVNLTMHGWFNLSGVPGSSVLDHELRIGAGQYTPVDERLIPTGDRTPVGTTPFDFREARRLGDVVARMPGGGYDHNFVLDASSPETVALSLYHPASGRRLDIVTDQPGMQVYTAQGLDGSLRTEEGFPIPQYGAIVLEPQHFPDSPNQPHFPSTVLRPGVPYRHVSRYTCTVQD